MTERWDDVIVGAGSAGSVLAARLSEEPSRRVLLLEAGPDPGPEGEEFPAALGDGTAPVLDNFTWRLSALLSSNSGRRAPYYAGCVVGGSSAVNGTMALPGSPADFDTWAALGNPEWAWDRVRPVFERLACGPVQVEFSRPHAPGGLEAAFQRACTALGLPAAGPVPTSTAGGRRVSAATAYLDPARRRPNLCIRAGSKVGRVLLEAERAAGVEVAGADGPLSVRAGRVTLSAGAIGTPAILLRSGIGDADACRVLGIPPAVDLPGVGEHLVDHPAVVIWAVPRPGVCQPGEPWHQVMALGASTPGGPIDLQLNLLNHVLAERVPSLASVLSGAAVGISAMLLTPASSGRVRLASADPQALPCMELELATAPEDGRRLAKGVRLAWALMHFPEFASKLERTLIWTETTIQREDLLARAVRTFVSPTLHAVGTARMGPAADAAAVVDQHLGVHGVPCLHVVDASVMPAIPSAPPNLTCMMLAERAAAWMA